MVADVDVNNHPVPGSLIPCADWCSTLRLILMGCLAKKMGWNKGTTNATLNAELAEVDGTVYCLSCLTQVCCCRDSRGTHSLKAMMKYLQSNVVLTRQVAWLMMTLLLCICWTAKGSCMCCKHLLDRLTLLLWMKNVGCLLRCPLGMHNECACLPCLEIYRLDLLCNCLQID